MKKNRYAAKLLFKYGLIDDERPLCIESILSFRASSPQEAIEYAKQRGKAMSAGRFKTSDGETVCYRFIGIMDIMDHGIASEPDEVWYEIHRRLLSKENRKRLLLGDKKLLEKIS